MCVIAKAPFKFHRFLIIVPYCQNVKFEIQVLVHGVGYTTADASNE